MRNATIFLVHRYGTARFAKSIGAELRARRLSAGISQRELAAPLTGAYISAVEAGRVFPSIPALAMVLDRLSVPLDVYFQAVNSRLLEAAGEAR